MEYVDGGDLLTFVREKTEGKLVEEDARWYFEQIVSVVDYLHHRRIVHRDLKMENILLQGADKKMVKIIDFGLSNVFSKGEFLSTKCGSPEYAAPELFRKDCKYGTEVDVWSLGIILYGMLIGQLPFRNGNYGKLVGLISKGLTSVHQEKMKNLNAECAVLLSNILQPESSRRYTIQNIMAHPWLCSGRNKLAIFRSPDVDRGKKQKLIKATAAIMELSRTEVSLAVESRQCDSIFAVYNILLQEELKQDNNHATKTVSSVVIRDHSNTARLAGGTAEKRRRMNEKETKSSRNTLQKSRLRSMQAKRLWAMKKRTQNSERKTFDGVSCVIGTSIGRPTTERNSTDRNEVEKVEINNNTSKGIIENEDKKCDDLPEVTCKNIVEQTSTHNENSKTEVIDQTDLENLNAGGNAECQVEQSPTVGQTTDKQDDLKTDNEESESDVTLNENDTFWCQGNAIARKPSDHIRHANQEVPLNETSCEEYVRAPASLVDISGSTSSDSLDGIGGHASTMVDNITESPIATPSLAASSISNILSLIGDEQCHNGQVWMDVDNNDLACTSEYNEVHSEIQNVERDGAACVTLQAIEVKKKGPTQQKFVGRARFKSAERKGSAFSTKPTKKTVNPSKDLEEAIEERLKPCLKNSAASLRERPHTANSKISRKSFQSESDMCVSNDLPPRPKTVASSQPRGGGLQVKSSNASTRDKSLTAALRARRAT
ncbi:hormonally up-regulated neu tumor-associated kinase-like, partial [Paramuricea clavata]